MLKFSDLSVDFKSYENSLNSYMKLFPGSYTPLLIMYLAHKGLLKLVHEFDENDPRILVSVDGKSLHEFFGDGIMKELVQDSFDWDQNNMSFKDAYTKLIESVLKDRDVYVMLPFAHMLPFILAGYPLALIADVPEDNQINDLIECICASDKASETPAALLFFSVMLMMKYEQDEIDEDDKHAEYHKKLNFQNWIDDFESTLGSIMSYAGNNNWIQPEELTRVILTQFTGGSIYNPFAGLASYAIQLHYECGEKNMPVNDRIYNNIGNYYYGDEIVDLAWAVGKLRLLAYDSDSDNYNLADSTKWREGSANNVLCTPPFVQIVNEDGKREYTDHFVIRRGIDLLADDGLLACVVPMSFMSRKDTLDIRKRIVEEGLLESIVYLPEDIFGNTSVRTAILFIRNKHHDYVNLINATNAIHHRSGKVNILDEEVVANLLWHATYPTYFKYDTYARMDVKLPEETFEKLKIYASNDRVASFNYDLTPGLYFLGNIPIIEGYRLIKLRDIVESMPERIGKTGKGKVVRPALLSKDNFTPLLVDSISEEEFKKQYLIVNQDALLFSPLASLRPTLFVNPNKESVYLKPDTVLAVYLKKEFIIPDYLIIELNKPYVQEQVRLLAKGDVIPRLSLEDFLSIQVYVPRTNNTSNALLLEKESVEQQKALYYSKINAELAALKDQQHSDFVKMLRQRKHRIQQVMNEFSPAFSMLNQLRKENGGVLHDNDIVASRTGKTVRDYFDKLETIVTKVEDLVTCLIEKEQWKKPVPVDIEQFIKSIPQNHISEKYEFQLVYDNETGELLEGLLPDFDNKLVLVDPDDLSVVFENIINNALKYGFDEEIRKDYVIRISLTSEIIDNQPSVRICVSNNGTPIHPSVDRKRFFDWGYGTNTGIGTWEIKSIIEHYGGTITLNEYPDEEAGFQTEYDIVLPLIKSEEWKKKLG